MHKNNGSGRVIAGKSSVVVPIRLALDWGEVRRTTPHLGPTTLQCCQHLVKQSNHSAKVNETLNTQL